MIKAGLFGIGLDTYWAQFDGLLNRLKGYQQEIAAKLAGFGVQVIDAGMVDNPFKANEATRSSIPKMWMLFFCLYPLCPCRTRCLPVAQKTGLPLSYNLQPVKAIDYKPSTPWAIAAK
jgi:L-arabinose isomerase